ncbi:MULTISPECIES: phosphatase PAP2 family protein [unclassified Pseudomonas]|jgi:membrane-associated PAP2 superfamily phosphatase|uniref:phosphatase PAP2 family protein n=1 Tax=unclassified Pseudomonas TaxID=196821 RepID=UPI000BA38157|nr:MULTISPECIES: phosphatase PAP2 family protein [unclassified Pseudomonas]MCU1734584.1 phosphatase PAP2 family protein [Pseudomonas sp. 20P_3.2_Bac4]MCU1747481.1 phosphatase PAP2 family protein [Pseudomonas sp. 20P_3.2_Bac5]
MSSSSRSRFYLLNLGVPLALALAVFLLFDLTNLDRWISNLLIDPATGQFLFFHDQLFEKLTHKWPRILPDWTGEAAIIGMLLSVLWPGLAKFSHTAPVRLLETARIAPVLRFTARHRRDFVFVVVAFALCTGVIHFLKSHTGVYCPVETTLYGGAQPHLEWFNQFSLLSKAGDGRCWPAGHASSGFTLLALYFVARRYRWVHARKLLVAILVVGFIYGTTRVLQGWHYMSHTFWAGIFVWLTSWATALVFYGRPALQAAPNRAARRAPSPAEGFARADAA